MASSSARSTAFGHGRRGQGAEARAHARSALGEAVPARAAPRPAGPPPERLPHLRHRRRRRLPLPHDGVRDRRHAARPRQEERAAAAAVGAARGCGRRHRRPRRDPRRRYRPPRREARQRAPDGRRSPRPLRLRARDGLPDSTMVSVFVGTPHYMAPEVREGDPATTRSDVWSLGVVLHEIFFGKRPERRSPRSAPGVSKGSTRASSSTIERAILSLCVRCLADDPADRPEDATAVERLFDSARRSPYALLKAPNRRLRVLATAAALVVVTAGDDCAGISAKSRVTPRQRRHAASRSDRRASRLDQREQASSRRFPIASIASRCRTSGRRGWYGAARHAEDIDLDSGDRRPSGLPPETYRTGCPELSPRGDRLLFTSTFPSGMTEIPTGERERRKRRQGDHPGARAALAAKRRRVPVQHRPVPRVGVLAEDDELRVAARSETRWPSVAERQGGGPDGRSGRSLFRGRQRQQSDQRLRRRAARSARHLFAADWGGHRVR